MRHSPGECPSERPSATTPDARVRFRRSGRGGFAKGFSLDIEDIRACALPPAPGWWVTALRGLTPRISMPSPGQCLAARPDTVAPDARVRRRRSGWEALLRGQFTGGACGSIRPNGYRWHPVVYKPPFSVPRPLPKTVPVASSDMGPYCSRSIFVFVSAFMRTTICNGGTVFFANFPNTGFFRGKEFPCTFNPF